MVHASRQPFALVYTVIYIVTAKGLSLQDTYGRDDLSPVWSRI